MKKTFRFWIGIVCLFTIGIFTIPFFPYIPRTINVAGREGLIPLPSLQNPEHYDLVEKVLEHNGERKWRISDDYLGISLTLFLDKELMWNYTTKAGRPSADLPLEDLIKQAEQGNVGAQYDLGLYYSDGLYVEPDYAEAYKWFSMAAEKGDHSAVNQLKIVTQLMTPGEIPASQESAEKRMRNN